MALHSHHASAPEHPHLAESRHLPAIPQNPNPSGGTFQPQPKPAPNSAFRPTTSAVFKREARRKRRQDRKRQKRLEENLECLLVLDRSAPRSSPPSLSTAEWPCAEHASEPNWEAAGWVVPSLKPNPITVPSPSPSPSAEERIRAAFLQAQQNALRQCQDFLAAEASDDEEEEEEGEGESKGIKFFVGLFEKDSGLRGFYEKNWRRGDFSCLVCRGIGEKLGKRYGNCIGLVQHANTVTRTKRREGHRALSMAVCRILNWDVDQLPGVADGNSQVETHKQIGNFEELGTDRSSSDLVESDGGELMDCAEADSDTD